MKSLTKTDIETLEEILWKEVGTKKCYGDIEIIVPDSSYEIRTKVKNAIFLNHITFRG